MKFELKKYNLNISDSDLLNDIRVCAKKLNKENITIEEYDNFGKYSSTTIRKRFGNWYQALKNAGMEYKSESHVITKEELLQNIKSVWETLGRQPTSSEIKKPLSKYSTRPYDRVFGSWQKALESFVEWVKEDNDINNSGEDVKPDFEEVIGKYIRKTNRNISDRLRFSILLRDGFRCQSCGKSPIKNSGIELQVDHIIPWSKGGETIPSNLQTKCKKCNLGKGNAFDK
jgi:5-methylcytosine-specific restriction endonuclease McrA